MNKKVRVHNYYLSMKQGSRIDGRIIIKDISRDQIRCTIDKEPQNGKTELTTNGYWSYIPNKKFIGTEEFKIKVFINGVGEKYSTIKIDIEEQEMSTKISKIIQFENKLKIDNYEDEIVEIKNIELVIEILDKKLIKNDFNRTSKLNILGKLKYLINYDVGIIPIKKKSFWFDEYTDEISEFIPENEVHVEKETKFKTLIDLGDFEIEDDIIIEYEVKYQNYKVINYDSINHYCAIELFINK